MEKLEQITIIDLAEFLYSEEIEDIDYLYYMDNCGSINKVDDYVNFNIEKLKETKFYVMSKKGEFE